MFEYFTKVHHLNNLLWVWNCRLKDGSCGDRLSSGYEYAEKIPRSLGIFHALVKRILHR